MKTQSLVARGHIVELVELNWTRPMVELAGREPGYGLKYTWASIVNQLRLLGVSNSTAGKSWKGLQFWTPLDHPSVLGSQLLRPQLEVSAKGQG